MTRRTALAAGALSAVAAAALVVAATRARGPARGAPAPAPAGNAARAPSPPRADGARALALVESLCAFGPRAPGTPGHATARAFLEVRLAAAGGEVRVDAFSIRSPEGVSVAAANIVARFRPEIADRVLVGAHWDTRPRADRDPRAERRGEPILGANDGGSGAALLLLLADAMRAAPPPVGVDLVLFDAEDWGREGDLANYCLGSSRYSAALDPAALPRAAVVVDMVGDRDLAIRKEANSRSVAPGLVDALWRIAGEVGADAFLDEPGFAIYDDHVPLIRAGILAALLIDLDYGAWHTHADRPDRVSARSLEQVGNVLFAWIYRGAPIR
jgi:Zn-dependent M28 family amino/carboxypeptidase